MWTYTPNYMLYTELGEAKIWQITITIKYKYEVKVRNEIYKKNYSKIIANELDRLDIVLHEELKKSRMCSLRKY